MADRWWEGAVHPWRSADQRRAPARLKHLLRRARWTRALLPLGQARLERCQERLRRDRLAQDARKITLVQVVRIASRDDDDRNLLEMRGELAPHVAATEAGQPQIEHDSGRFVPLDVLKRLDTVLGAHDVIAGEHQDAAVEGAQRRIIFHHEHGPSRRHDVLAWNIRSIPWRQPVPSSRVRHASLVGGRRFRPPNRISRPDAPAIVANVGRLLERLLGADIECSLRLDESVPLILGDTQQLENVLTNLAVNARDAMPKGGRLTISTGDSELTEEDAEQHAGISSGRYVVLTVEDTGHGMDEATKARVFEPFFTTKGLGRGTGLGLSMVYGIVKQMQGFVWLYSEVGRGTTFRLYFPATGEAARPDRQPAATVPVAGGRKARILVIDDDAGIREFVTRTLSRQGHKVYDAA